jgi:hypothetical protein
MDYKYDSKKKDFILTKTEEFYSPSNYSATWSKATYHALVIRIKLFSKILTTQK